METNTKYIYFVNDYRKRVVEKVNRREEKLFKTVNKTATKEQFETTIEKEMKTLGIDRASVLSLLAPPVFVNAETLPYI